VPAGDGGAVVSDTVRLRATWVVGYDADPADYAPNGRPDLCVTPQVMADMDGDIEDVVSLMADADHVRFTVTPAEMALEPPASQHVDEDPERSMQEDRVDIP
jgi:hypothetical protein